MKIVNMLGGLGNQMFQYAFALGLKAEFPEETIKISIQSFRGYPLHNGFELDRIFDIKLPFATLRELSRFAWPWGHYRFWQVGRKILPKRLYMIWDNDFDKAFDYNDIKDKCYFDGYWQSPRFFIKHEELIKQSFKFPQIIDSQNLEIVNFINADRTAFIHVRRGDYINHPTLGNICSLQYYIKGIELLQKSYGFKQFIFFSNDIDWCRQELSQYVIDNQVRFVDWNNSTESFRDMQLMSLCKGALIANSSFSWWGAWLSKADVVICPDKWSKNPNKHRDIYPDGWIKLNSN